LSCPAEELVGGPNEVWSFGERAYTIIKELLFLRERMKPYLAEQMKRAHEESIPVMRPLFFDFPEDEKAYEAEDEYLFGPDILVAPVIYEGERRREVYLPQGAQWTEAKSGQTYQGGQRIEVEAPLETIPIFLRDGAKMSTR
jgi:alpha-D-xyloside xylohydrolase